MNTTKEPRITPGVKVKVQGRAAQAWMGQHVVMAEAPAHPGTVPFGDTQLAKPGARGKHPTWIQFIIAGK